MEPLTPVSPGCHPEPEDLLLYRSGELPPEEERLVAGHVECCAHCRDRIQRNEATLQAVSRARAEAQRLSVVPEIPSPPRARRLGPAANWHLARGAAVAAAGLCVAFFLTSETTSARMDTFLSQGARRESEASAPGRTFIRVRRGSAKCFAPNGLSGRVLVSAAGGEAGPCRELDSVFRGAGWQWGQALSLKAYQRWRASLSGKSDEMSNAQGLTVVSTSTGKGPLRKATLWVRASDYHAMSGRFEFLNVGEVEVTEVDTPQVYAAPEAPRPAAENLIAIHRPAAEDPDFVEKQLDEAEMRVRIALRGLNADAGFETVVERENDAVIVRGVARTQERWQAIDDALRGIPRVRQLVVTEEEEERTQAPVPWMPEFHYSEPPLAVKQLRAVFSDPAVEQEFSDAVLGLTRSIASYAQARDQMNRLLEKRGKADEAAATRASMDEIQARMQAALDEVAQRLAPLIGSVERTQSVPDADQAMELYRQVYALIYLSGPEQTDPSAAAERIRSLLAASYEL